MGRRRVSAPSGVDPRGRLVNIIRFDFFGDKGKQVGSNVSRERAEEYVREHQAADPNSVFEIVKA